jgi:hypothetical protein
MLVYHLEAEDLGVGKRLRHLTSFVNSPYPYLVIGLDNLFTPYLHVFNLRGNEN